MSSLTTPTNSRRPHSKSRKGCKTCKRRHIKCDEAFPQCRNCSKHQVRCDYMDSAGDSPLTPAPQSDLYWSSEVDAVLSQWQRAGACSVGRTTVALSSSGHIFSKNDLNLVYHALWSSGPNTSSLTDYTVWTSKTPRLLAAAADTPFFINAFLGFGALSLAWERNSSDAKALGYQHSATAFQGLHNAINAFSQDNSDAILASSTLLSWQVNDWRSWSSLMAGIRTVLNSMREWRSESKLQDFVDQQDFSVPLDPTSSAMDTQNQNFALNYTSTLRSIETALGQLEPFMVGREEHSYLGQFRDYVQRLLSISPAQSAEEQFNHLYAFRKWLFWVPSAILKTPNQDYLTLVFLAHLYSMALSFEPLFPDVAPAFCSAISREPLEKILSKFEELRTSSAGQEQVQNLLALATWPNQVATAYSSRHYLSTYAEDLMHDSPVGFDIFSSDMTAASEVLNLGQPSPAFGAVGGSWHGRSSSDYSSSAGTPYLDVPGLSSMSSNRSYPPTLPSMISGIDDEALYTESQFDYSGTRGSFSNRPGPPRGRSE